MNAVSPTTVKTHQPWCDDHHTGRHAEDDWCQSSRVTIGDIDTHISPGNDARPAVWLDDNGDGELSPAQTLQLADRLRGLAEQLTSANPEALKVIKVPLNVINEVRGTSHTLESVAAECGVDLAEATAADASRMALYVGGTLMR